MNIDILDKEGRIKVPLLYIAAQIFLFKGFILFFITLSEGNKVAKPLYTFIYWEPIALIALFSFSLIAIVSHISFLTVKKHNSKSVNVIWNNQYSILKWALIADFLLIVGTMAINKQISEINLFVSAASLYLLTSWLNNDLIKTFVENWNSKKQKS